MPRRDRHAGFTAVEHQALSLVARIHSNANPPPLPYPEHGPCTMHLTATLGEPDASSKKSGRRKILLLHLSSPLAPKPTTRAANICPQQPPSPSIILWWGFGCCAVFTRYDKNHPSAVTLDAFDGAHMEPHVFREQLKRVRKAPRIDLAPWELCSLSPTAHPQPKEWSREVENVWKHPSCM